MKASCTLFLQRLPHRAGAQTCLIRLLKQTCIQQLNPVLITSSDGWLNQQAQEIGIRTFIVEFPSARSLAGKLYKNQLFSKKIIRLLSGIDFHPRFIVGNDYLENIHVINLCKAFQAQSITFIRSSGLKHQDFLKYKCNQTRLLLPIGDALAQQIAPWVDDSLVATSLDGLLPEEFEFTHSYNKHPPKKFLVIGTPNPAKGWLDVYQAVSELDLEKKLPTECQFDFTGTIPKFHTHNYRLNGLGRLDGLSSVFHEYDAVINPSRSESFGMAAMEAIAAGIPVISSNTGVAKEIISDINQIFTPGNTKELGQAIVHLIQNYPTCHNVAKIAKERLLQRYPASRQAKELCDALNLLNNN